MNKIQYPYTHFSWVADPGDLVEACLVGHTYVGLIVKRTEQHITLLSLNDGFVEINLPVFIKMICPYKECYAS